MRRLHIPGCRPNLPPLRRTPRPPPPGNRRPRRSRRSRANRSPRPLQLRRSRPRRRAAIPPDEIIWLNLDPRAGFVLAQIDGEVSFDDLYAICGLKRLDTARILCELLEQGVVQVQGRDQAVAKRAVPRS